MLSVLSAPRGNDHVADWGSGNIAPLCAFVKVTQRPISMDYHKNGRFLWNLPYCHVAAEKNVCSSSIVPSMGTSVGTNRRRQSHDRLNPRGAQHFEPES